MRYETKAQISCGTALAVPLVMWLITAKAVYGFNEQNIKHVLAGLIPQTFTLSHWPLWVALIVGEVLAIVGLVIGFKLAKKPFQGASFETFYRGTQIVKPDELARKTKERNQKQITISGVPVPTKAETTHFCIGGATGTGKSTLFKEMILGVMRRKERMVILDPDGDYFSTFGRPGKDIILNPYDARTQGWSFFNEITQDYDFDRLALSMIPPSKSADSEEWQDYARKLLVAVAKRLHRDNRNVSIQDVHYYTNGVSDEDLGTFVKGSAVSGLFTSNAQKALASTRFVLAAKLAPHLIMPPGTFSLSTWLANPEGGNLYITWDEQMRESLRPLISTWADAIFSGALGLTPDRDRRIWVFLDELESLSRLPSLNDALTKGRKKGLCVVTGFQSYSQLIDVYGREIAETMLSNHRTIVAMAVGRGGTTTAEHMSLALGEHEIMRHNYSRSVGLNANIGSAGEADHITRERVVLPSEIMALPDLTGYLAFPGDLPITKFKTEHKKYTRSEKVPGIVSRTNKPIIQKPIASDDIDVSAQDTANA
ncbi:type IV secretion system DNA-binding domain-containing protein [Acetobacter persici]|uniref:type IV secretion system DNA-binding domain-containing protein n=1 Tax=Acetobacter persici TaxID=1076596 RepID=UPI001BA89A4A|nr:type IV secretion system DNA-binding domain-containing protein [Acetobacter persici]MBS1017023.1 type IV secretion system DNA-binding domain-containing protein [Acetobacter persici]